MADHEPRQHDAAGGPNSEDDGLRDPHGDGADSGADTTQAGDAHGRAREASPAGDGAAGNAEGENAFPRAADDGGGGGTPAAGQVGDDAAMMDAPQAPAMPRADVAESLGAEGGEADEGTNPAMLQLHQLQALQQQARSAEDGVTGAPVDATAAGAGGAPDATGDPTVAGAQGVEQSPMLAQNDQSFVCNICRKSFKREMNLIFHMTTHRQRQTVEGIGEVQSSNAPVKCSDCPKVFATKYQAKKHFLRRHFKGERPYKCRKCNKKSFTVKEDLTMHMKACGQVFTCSCGIRLCSLGALKRHAKYFKHEPTNWEGTPVHGDYGMMRSGMDDVAGVLLAAHDGSGKVPAGDDGDSDDDDDGALGPHRSKDHHHRGMMPVDMADGAAAHALLMADSSRMQHFDHGSGSAPMPPNLPLWQVQQQANAQMLPEAMMRQQMQLHHLAHLNQQQVSVARRDVAPGRAPQHSAHAPPPPTTELTAIPPTVYRNARVLSAARAGPRLSAAIASTNPRAEPASPDAV